MLGIIVMFVAVAILSCLDITGWKVTYFAVNLVCAAFISVFAAIYQVVSVSLASSLPNRYMEAVFSGQVCNFSIQFKDDCKFRPWLELLLVLSVLLQLLSLMIRKLVLLSSFPWLLVSHFSSSLLFIDYVE